MLHLVLTAMASCCLLLCVVVGNAVLWLTIGSMLWVAVGSSTVVGRVLGWYS
jgi:hypothetical protein